MLWPHALCCSCAWRHVHDHLHVVRAVRHLSPARQQPLEHNEVNLKASAAVQLALKSMKPLTEVLDEAAQGAKQLCTNWQRL